MDALYSPMNTILEQLKNKRLLWQAKQQSADNLPLESTGYPELDQALQGGFPQTGVVDLHSPVGIGELRLLLPALSARHQREHRMLVFIAPLMQLNGEMLAHYGFDLNQVLILKPNSPSEALWSAEQCLKSGICHSVLLWHNDLDVAQVKRLQLAAEKGDAVQFMFRSHPRMQIPLPVTLAMRLSAQKQGLAVQITKRKGGWPSEQFHLSMQRQWPQLTVVESYDNVVAFARSHAS